MFTKEHEDVVNLFAMGYILAAIKTRFWWDQFSTLEGGAQYIYFKCTPNRDAPLQTPYP